jgi:hypothetical protein
MQLGGLYKATTATVIPLATPAFGRINEEN